MSDEATTAQPTATPTQSETAAEFAPHEGLSFESGGIGRWCWPRRKGSGGRAKPQFHRAKWLTRIGIDDQGGAEFVAQIGLVGADVPISVAGGVVDHAPVVNDEGNLLSVD